MHKALGDPLQAINSVQAIDRPLPIGRWRHLRTSASLLVTRALLPVARSYWGLLASLLGHRCFFDDFDNFDSTVDWWPFADHWWPGQILIARLLHPWLVGQALPTSSNHFSCSVAVEWRGVACHKSVWVADALLCCWSSSSPRCKAPAEWQPAARVPVLARHMNGTG